MTGRALVAATLFLASAIGCATHPAERLARVGEPTARPLTCPPDMAQIGAYCMDHYEAYVVEVLPGGRERAHSPFDVVEGLDVRAKNAKGVIPQAYISQVQAAGACASAGKRLCTETEFHTACSGGDPVNYYPYGGQVRMPGYCNEGKGSSMVRFFGDDPQQWTYAEFNDPRLNQAEGGLAPAGRYERCVSPFGVHDCVGNLHEWGADPADEKGHGRFRGGFYGDAENNGHGCRYVTHAHEPTYHDYSTGFRCCEDAR
jgi:sulfatase modifying factor 1